MPYKAHSIDRLHTGWFFQGGSLRRGQFRSAPALTRESSKNKRHLVGTATDSGLELGLTTEIPRVPQLTGNLNGSRARVGELVVSCLAWAGHCIGPTEEPKETRKQLPRTCCWPRMTARAVPGRDGHRFAHLTTFINYLHTTGCLSVTAESCELANHRNSWQMHWNS